jgi:hypothetical protein
VKAAYGKTVRAVWAADGGQRFTRASSDPTNREPFDVTAHLEQPAKRGSIDGVYTPKRATLNDLLYFLKVTAIFDLVRNDGLHASWRQMSVISAASLNEIAMGFS